MLHRLVGVTQFSTTNTPILTLVTFTSNKSLISDINSRKQEIEKNLSRVHSVINTQGLHGLTEQHSRWLTRYESSQLANSHLVDIQMAITSTADPIVAVEVESNKQHFKVSKDLL